MLRQEENMPQKLNMICDRCHEGEHAEWCERLGCYLCQECAKIEYKDDQHANNR